MFVLAFIASKKPNKHVLHVTDCFIANKSVLIKGFEPRWVLSTPISSVPDGSNRYTLLNIYRSPWLWRPRSGKIPNKSIGRIHRRRWLSQFLNIFILLQSSHEEGCYELQPIDVLTAPSPLCEIMEVQTVNRMPSLTMCTCIFTAARWSLKQACARPISASCATFTLIPAISPALPCS